MLESWNLGLWRDVTCVKSSKRKHTGEHDMQEKGE